MILVDTTLLIDLQRGTSNPCRRDAESWIAKNPNEELAVPAIVLGEFAEGFTDQEHPLLVAYRTCYPVIPVDTAVATRYAILSRHLRSTGAIIGTNDTWIAATALSNSHPVLTRNANHFSRIPNLTVIDYTNHASNPSG